MTPLEIPNSTDDEKESQDSCTGEEFWKKGLNFPESPADLGDINKKFSQYSRLLQLNCNSETTFKNFDVELTNRSDSKPTS